MRTKLKLFILAMMTVLIQIPAAKVSAGDYEISYLYNMGGEGYFANLGSAYAKLGLREKAIEIYRKALKIDPNYSDAIKYLNILSR